MTMFWLRNKPANPSTDETPVETSPTDLEQGVKDTATQTQQQQNGPKPTINDAADADNDKDKDGKQPVEPSEAFTGHQKFYIFVMDGLGGMVLSGGVNFAIAYVMYTTQNTTKNPIRLFQLPNTLAGDAAVTIIIQCILTWFVEMFLVRHDLKNRTVQPMGFLPEPSKRWLRWLFFLPLDETETGTEMSRFSVSSILQQALRGFLLAVAGFFLLWPAGVGILTAFGERSGGDWVFSDRWTPQVFKLVLGGLLGLLTTPLMAMFWLLKAGWSLKQSSEGQGESV